MEIEASSLPCDDVGQALESRRDVMPDGLQKDKEILSNGFDANKERKPYTS